MAELYYGSSELVIAKLGLESRSRIFADPLLPTHIIIYSQDYFYLIKTSRR